MIKTILMVFAGFLVCVLYIFVSSAAAGRNSSGKSAAMYGLDSLEYVGEPVMKISVWQKNAIDPQDYPGTSSKSALFYNILPLELTPGTTIRNLEENSRSWKMHHRTGIFNVEYDGPLRGGINIPYGGRWNLLAYGKLSDEIPMGMDVGGFAEGNLAQLDNSFYHEGSLTMRIMNTALQHVYWQRTDTGKPDAKAIEDNGWWDFTTEQTFHEVYPDAPDTFKKVYRLVMTTELTINAMHQRKIDVPIATAILEIRDYSLWICPDVELSRTLTAAYPNIWYSDITVKSYTQNTEIE